VALFFEKLLPNPEKAREHEISVDRRRRLSDRALKKKCISVFCVW